jgi:type VI secretion system ImpA family protein
MAPNSIDAGFRFDPASLLNPIPGASPAGESLRYEGTYDRIREARTEDNPVLAQGVWKTPLKKAQWSDIAGICLDALENRSKDIQICAWLTEAWLHLYGLAGLREGLRAMAALCDRFWDDLHPSSADDNLEYRLAPIEWINEKLPPLIRLLPLTEPGAEDIPAYSWNDWESAARLTSGDGAAVKHAQFEQSAMLTPTPLYSALAETVESAGRACAQLEDILRERCGDHAASLRQVANVLDQIRGFVVSTLNQREDGDGKTSRTLTQAEPGAESAGEDAPPFREPSTHGGPIRDRSEAYRRLAEAADYLARTEPHSPTPYLVRRAVAWGSLRLEELLPELVQNNSDLGEIYRLLQINKPAGR